MDEEEGKGMDAAMDKWMTSGEEVGSREEGTQPNMHAGATRTNMCQQTRRGKTM